MFAGIYALKIISEKRGNVVNNRSTMHIRGVMNDENTSSNCSKCAEFSGLHVAKVRVEIEPVLKAAASAFNVNAEAVIGNGRPAMVYLARRAAMAHLASQYSPDLLAAVFRRTRGAISYSLREHSGGIETDSFYRARNAQFLAGIKGKASK